MDMCCNSCQKKLFFSKMIFTKKGIHNEIKVEFIILLFRRKYQNYVLQYLQGEKSSLEMYFVYVSGFSKY